MSAINEISDEQLVRDSANNVSGAIEELIGRYRSVVSSIVAKYNNAPLEKEDLIQEGLIGLLAAINSY
ncbi:MAG: RNA polymerase subunit sigma-70, partial [Eubacterium sp.]|nr:RNA polymerase subunit sigma-70 [Eubacterium sp.]